MLQSSVEESRFDVNASLYSIDTAKKEMQSNKTKLISQALAAKIRKAIVPLRDAGLSITSPVRSIVQSPQESRTSSMYAQKHWFEKKNPVVQSFQITGMNVAAASQRQTIQSRDDAFKTVEAR
jgi:hypothetical protein